MEGTMNRRFRILLAIGLLFSGVLVISLRQAQSEANGPSSATPADYLKWRNEMKN
jgi:hypothetical protein